MMITLNDVGAMPQSVTEVGMCVSFNSKPGDLVTEYTGEVIDVSEANRRILDALGGHNALSSITSSRKDFHPVSETYLARLSPRMDLILDAKNQGSLSRFINHACEPNLYAECWIVDGHPRLGK
ncbi:unnamed protein product [Trichobilharzia regenti]|nr:unnamed protein product [Trichobilharzia regenti]